MLRTTALLGVLVALSLGAGCKGTSSESQSRAKPAEPVAKAKVEVAPEIETGPDDGSSAAVETHTKFPNAYAVGRQGAVTSAEPNATDIGLAVLKRGGNAVDAAVAVGFALGVSHPSAGNIGGGGFMVIRLPDGKSIAIDYREMAPGAATSDMFVNDSGDVTNDSRLGPLAAGIPGVVAGLWLAHQNYGSLPWESLVTPAVALAKEGWKLDSYHADDLSWVVPVIEKYRGNSKKALKLREAIDATLATFRPQDGGLYKEGDVWKQPALATTLEAIAKGGQDAFYKGPFAKKMAASMQAMGGLWTAKDLANYRPIVRETIDFKYQGYDIITMPPPSAGGIVLRQVLAAADTLDLEKLDWDSTQRVHLYVEALRRTYADRNALIGDPGFVKIPMEKLLDVKYMTKRMADVDPKRASLSSDIRSGVAAKESEQTTHFSILDKSGMAVSNTYTLNGGFGAKLQIPGTGVTLNNEMDDFTAKVGAANQYGLVQGPQNGVAPGKRMLSSMTPTIVAKDGKVRAILGSPGGPTITTTVVQILLQILDHDRTLQEAVAAPRIHHQWMPDKIWVEKNVSAKLVRELRGMGHTVTERGRIGHANCIAVSEDGEMQAVADVARDGGKAAAY